MKDIYVAGPSSQIDQIEGFMAILQEAGWSITFDWTVPVREVGNASPDDVTIRRDAALADLSGVSRARVLWLVQPDASSSSTGAWVELGYALALRGCETPNSGHRTIIASGSSKKCIFSDLADYRFESHDDALKFIISELRYSGPEELNLEGK